MCHLLFSCFISYQSLLRGIAQSSSNASISGFPLRATPGNPGAFVEIVRYLLPEGVGENITFVHRDCTPGSRPWGFAGQRYTLSTIPGCCSRCSLRTLLASNQFTEFHVHTRDSERSKPIRLFYIFRKKKKRKKETIYRG